VLGQLDLGKVGHEILGHIVFHLEAGREFHSWMVLGKNVNFMQLVLDHRYIFLFVAGY